MSDTEQFRDRDALVHLLLEQVTDVRDGNASIDARVSGFGENAVFLEFDQQGWGTLAVPGIKLSRLAEVIRVGDDVRLVMETYSTRAIAEIGSRLFIGVSAPRSRNPAREFWARYYARRARRSAPPVASPRFLFCTPEGSVAFFAEGFRRLLNDIGPNEGIVSQRLVIHVAVSDDETLKISPTPPKQVDALDDFLKASDSGERAVVERDAIVDIGNWLRALRGERISLREVAEKAASTAATLSQVERGLGSRGPTVALVSRVLFALGLEVALRADKGEPSRIVFAAVPLQQPFSDGGPDDALAEFLKSSNPGVRAVAERDGIVRLGRFLRDLRGDRTLEEIAAAAGTNEATLSLLERGLGERGPTIGLVARIGRALGRSLIFENETP
ncbi:helix-turn-helix transcriptional regulator [Thalassobaculum sp.]|uniref:helix-turn-helix domain-containing protein n=1 Tax=Thalassobaculum sp. TaxID=2022740 RepID=UPI0032EE74CF